MASLRSMNFETAKQRIFIVPRWGGAPESDWYPLAIERLGALDGVGVCVLDMPGWSTPTLEGSAVALRAALPPERLGASTLLVGHSVGCQALLHHLGEVARSAPDARIGGLICVAGWFSVDAPWESIVPWIEATHDFETIRRVCGRIEVLLSDNDPFTSDHMANAALWRERLGAEVHLHPGAKHFNDAAEPAPLAALRAWCEPHPDGAGQ